MKPFNLFVCCLIIAAAIGVFHRETISDAFAAEPKRMETADNGNCATCHGGNKVLPDSHVATTGMTGKSCKTCHQDKARSRKGKAKAPLSHTHMWNGVSCSSCHGKVSPPKAMAVEKCFSCHGDYHAVAKLTKDLSINPHESHFGFIECGSCHKLHGKSELSCNKCHDFDMKVP